MIICIIIKLFQSVVVNTYMDITDDLYIYILVLVSYALSYFLHVT